MRGPNGKPNSESRAWPSTGADALRAVMLTTAGDAARAACANPARTTDAGGDAGNAICWAVCAVTAFGSGRCCCSHCGFNVATTNRAASTTVTACAKISQSRFNTDILIKP